MSTKELKINPETITLDQHGCFEIAEITDTELLDEVSGGKGFNIGKCGPFASGFNIGRCGYLDVN